jgi:hypothetical protein
VRRPHSLHTAEATGSKPVTPTSTNVLLEPCGDACCQQIASKLQVVVAVALRALLRLGVLGTSMATGENPAIAEVMWGSNPVLCCSTIPRYVWHKETSKRPRRTVLVCDGNKDLELPILSQSSSDVYHELRSKLLDVCLERFGPGCHIDLEAFDAIGPDVEWRTVLRESS